MPKNMKQALANLNKALAQSGFSVQVAGGDKLSLDLAGNKIDQPDDFYLSGWLRSDGTYNISASLYMDKPGIDGFVQKVRLEYQPSTDVETPGEFTMTEVEAATAKVLTPRELQAKIETMTQEIAGFEGYLSPSEVKAKVDEAVAAVKPADDVGDDLLTQDQVQTQIDESHAKRDAIEASLVSRSEKIVAEGFTLTDERKSHLATFAVDEAGNKEFTTWLTGLKTAQVAMLKDLDLKGIETTDKIKSAVACLNNMNESGYTALVAAQGAEAGPAFAPSLAASGDAGAGADGEFPRVM